jgi:hypothetical protein
MEIETMETKRIVCLANSRKPPSGRCIAGKTLDGAWVRPVSGRASREVSEEERRYESGSKAALLDIIDVPIRRADPFEHQSENYLLDDNYYWTKIGRSSWTQVINLCDAYDPNFWATAESTYNGRNDKVPAANARRTRTSLKLIHIPELVLKVSSDDAYGGGPSRRRLRGEFEYVGVLYRLMVTDPEVEEEYLRRGDGTYEVGDVALCISLAEVWQENGYASRLIASVITEELC